MTCLKALLLVSSAAALQAPCTRRPATHLAAVSLAELAEQSSLPPADKSRITVLSDAEAVGQEVWARIDEAGKRAVKERGTFTLAIPGGSVLKMLAGTKPGWAEDCLLAYVNHKAVNDDDAALSTHAKARAGFLDAGWDGVDVLNLGGSSDAVAEACRYAELLELATQQNPLPVAATASGETIPVFDMMVIGVGDDGHVGFCEEIKVLWRIRAESSRRPPRHRRDACSMAWRCRFLTARRSQRGRAIAEI